MDPAATIEWLCRGLTRPPSAMIGRVALTIATGVILLALGGAPAVAAQAPAADYRIADGWFYTPTGGAPDRGFAVTNAAGIPFWTTFRDAGGPAALGYPVSDRWVEGPFTMQAFQKAILQWADGSGMAYLNTYDVLARLGHDAWLDAVKNVPRSPTEPLPGTPAEIRDARLGLLDLNEAIQAVWYAAPNWPDRYGIPVAYEDRGDLRVLRSQRAVFQQWMIDTVFAAPGDVVIANGGDHYKQAGLIPTAAVRPLPAPEPATLSGRIAFVSDRTGEWEIHRLEPAAGEPVAITDIHEVNGRPSWSPDGTRLAFTSYFQGAFDVFSVNADGSELQQLTDTPEVDWEPSWSPDGRRLAFISTRDGTPALYRMNADGSDQRAMLSDPAGYCYPAWSPNGLQIAVAVGPDIHILPLDAEGKVAGDSVNLGPGNQPSWSPDGARIVFSRWDGDNLDVYIVNADGTNLRRVTSHPALDQYPVWSPDGQMITFSSYRDGNWELYAVSVYGDDLTRLTESPATEFLPAWTG